MQSDRSLLASPVSALRPQIEVPAERSMTRRAEWRGVLLRVGSIVLLGNDVVHFEAHAYSLAHAAGEPRPFPDALLGPL